VGADVVEKSLLAIFIPADRASKVMVSVCPVGVRTPTFNSPGIVTVRSSVVIGGVPGLLGAGHADPSPKVQSQVSVLVVGSGRVKIT
jgi:hypothetical protein